jgi:single-stranded DNA-binding protein
MAFIHINGRLTEDAKIVQVGKTSILKCQVAENVYDRETKTDVAVYYSVDQWGPSEAMAAKILPLLVKGAQVSARGEFSQRSYQAKDGSRKTGLDVRGTVDLIASPREKASPPAALADSNLPF